MDFILQRELPDGDILTFPYTSFDELYKEHTEEFKKEEYYLENYPELFPFSSADFFTNFQKLPAYKFYSSRTTVVNLGVFPEYRDILCPRCKRITGNVFKDDLTMCDHCKETVKTLKERTKKNENF